MHIFFLLGIFPLCHSQENLSILALQSVYDASMPHPCKEAVRGEILPSAWILEPDVVNGRDITRVIYMAQVRLCSNAKAECKSHYRSECLKSCYIINCTVLMLCSVKFMK